MEVHGITVMILHQATKVALGNLAILLGGKVSTVLLEQVADQLILVVQEMQFFPCYSQEQENKEQILIVIGGLVH